MRKATLTRFACVSLLLLSFIPLAPALAGPNLQAVYDRTAEIKSKAVQGRYLEAATQ